MEFYRFGKTSVAIFALFALVLMVLVVCEFSPIANMAAILISAIIVCDSVTTIEEAKGI